MLRMLIATSPSPPPVLTCLRKLRVNQSEGNLLMNTSLVVELYPDVTALQGTSDHDRVLLVGGLA